MPFYDRIRNRFTFIDKLPKIMLNVLESVLGVFQKYILFFLFISVLASQVGGCFVNQSVTGDYSYDILNYVVFGVSDFMIIILFYFSVKELSKYKKAFYFAILILTINYITYSYIQMMLFATGMLLLFVMKQNKNLKFVVPVFMVVIGGFDADTIWLIAPVVFIFFLLNINGSEKKDFCSFIKIVCFVFICLVLEELLFRDIKTERTIAKPDCFVSAHWQGILILGLIYCSFCWLKKNDNNPMARKAGLLNHAIMLVVFSLFGLKEMQYNLALVAAVVLLLTSINKGITIKRQFIMCCAHIRELLWLAAGSVLFIEFPKGISRILNDDAGKYIISQYYMTYVHFGFGQRGVIGTIVYFLFGYHISIQAMIWINLGLAFLAVALCVWVLLRILKRAENYQMKLFVPLVLACGGVSIYLSGDATQDVVCFLLTLFCISLILKNGIGVWLVPILCGLAVCIHPIFVMLEFPAVFCALIASLTIKKEKTVRCLMVSLLTLFLISVLFLYFMLYSNHYLIGDLGRALDLVWDRMGKNAEYLYRKSALGEAYITFFKDVLFPDIKVHLSYWDNIMPGKAEQLNSVRNVIVLLPLYIYFIKLCSCTAKKQKESWKRLLLRILPACFMVIIPCYLFETDYYRWDLGLYNMLFFGTLSMLYVSKETGDCLRLKRSKIEKWYLLIMLGALGLFRIHPL